MIYLLSVVCQPHKHYLASIMYDDTAHTRDEAGEKLAELLTAARAEKRCALCFSTSLTTDHQPTGFHFVDQTNLLPVLMEAARPAVRGILNHIQSTASN